MNARNSIKLVSFFFMFNQGGKVNLINSQSNNPELMTTLTKNTTSFPEFSPSRPPGARDNSGSDL